MPRCETLVRPDSGRRSWRLRARRYRQRCHALDESSGHPPGALSVDSVDDFIDLGNWSALWPCVPVTISAHLADDCPSEAPSGVRSPDASQIENHAVTANRRRVHSARPCGRPVRAVLSPPRAVPRSLPKHGSRSPSCASTRRNRPGGPCPRAEPASWGNGPDARSPTSGRLHHSGRCDGAGRQQLRWPPGSCTDPRRCHLFMAVIRGALRRTPS